MAEAGATNLIVWNAAQLEACAHGEGLAAASLAVGQHGRVVTEI